MGQGNIIGYEINEKTCQISFYNEEMAEPETMEVDADNYQIPELYLGYGSCSTTYQELKAWYKKQGIPKEAAYDVEKASAAVEGLLTAGTGNA